MAWLRVWVLGLVALGVWFLSNYESQPHPQNYAAKSATEFSEVRAQAVLARLLGPERPHPVSSDENAAVRGRILKEYAALGVPTHTYKAFTCNSWRGAAFVSCATVIDVIAEVAPGQGKAIVLLAHYDSVPAGPGASDDESGVATVLETVRALKAAGAKSKHPIIAVITDGEEAGLLGANAFLQNAALKARVGAVVNVEARGTSGQSLLFQTSSGDSKLINLYAAHAPVMATSSLYAEIYKFLPNDTDLTLFIRAGFPSFNFAFADNVRYYHSPKDLRANLDPATLQMHGDNMLGVVSGLEQTDFAALKGGNDVYLSLFGAMLPRVSESMALPLAIFVFLALGFAAWLARREPVSWRATALAAAMPLALLIGCGLLGWLLALIAQTISGQPDPTYAYPIAMRIALAFAVWTVTLAVSRMASVRGATASAWLWMAGLGVIVAAFLPGLSPYFVFPSLVAVVLLLPTARMGWDSTIGQVALFVSAVFAMMVWFALVSSGETLMGLKLHPLFTIPAAFGLMTLIPLLVARTMSRDAWRWSVIASLVLALAVGVLAGLHPTYSNASPQRINLYYAQAPNAPARWAAVTTWKGAAASPIPAPLIKAGGFTVQHDDFTGFDLGDIYVAKAGAPLYPLPTATVASDKKTNGARSITLRLHGSAATSAMALRIPKEAKLIAVDFRGQHMAVPKDYSGSTVVECLSRDCADMPITLTMGNTAPMTLVFAEQRYSLPPSGNFLKAARPSDAMPSQSGDEIDLANSVKLP
ncbi:MAG TPA: M20/M25/M40 family metallo-hydrolase [Rhizomicrobium sp.]|jgi:hypothetical protein|nr:M20/M25/M40 family metallo-hydrolase [Rhizomicrobium sp.]